MCFGCGRSSDFGSGFSSGLGSGHVVVTLLRIEAVTRPDDALRQVIAAPLLVFNAALAGPSGHQPLVLTLVSTNNEVVGGLWAATGYGWLYTQMLVVPEAARGAGWGQQLMQQAEAQAVQRGCHHAWVDTQFGALGFYEKLGYAVFGELPDYPIGFKRHFLCKALATSAPASMLTQTAPPKTVPGKTTPTAKAPAKPAP